MTRHIKAEFDGRVLIPRGPVDLPVGQTLDLEIRSNGTPAGDGREELRLQSEALERFLGCFNGPTLPTDALRRENLYEERA